MSSWKRSVGHRGQSINVSVPARVCPQNHITCMLLRLFIGNCFSRLAQNSYWTISYAEASTGLFSLFCCLGAQSRSCTDELTRGEAATLIQLRTGHIGLNSHLNRISRADTPWCSHCGVGNVENITHLLYICPAYGEERAQWERSLKERTREPAEYLGTREGIKETMKFIRRTGRLKMGRRDTARTQQKPQSTSSNHRGETRTKSTRHAQRGIPENRGGSTMCYIGGATAQ